MYIISCIFKVLGFKVMCSNLHLGLSYDKNFIWITRSKLIGLNSMSRALDRADPGPAWFRQGSLLICFSGCLCSLQVFSAGSSASTQSLQTKSSSEFMFFRGDQLLGHLPSPEQSPWPGLSRGLGVAGRQDEPPLIHMTCFLWNREVLTPEKGTRSE